MKPTGRFPTAVLALLATSAKNSGFLFWRPYLNNGANFTQGVNFAVAGATALETRISSRGKASASRPFKPTSATTSNGFNKYLDSTCGNRRRVQERIENSLRLGEYGGTIISPQSTYGKILDEATLTSRTSLFVDMAGTNNFYEQQQIRVDRDGRLRDRRRDVDRDVFVKDAVDGS
nr:acetylajmalan esterase-like [Ipomoea batatas]